MTILGLALLAHAYAADVPVESRITGVTVYLDRARVTRTVSVDVLAGPTALIFDDLPIGLLPASLAAEGEGTASATLTGIDVRPERGVEDRDERIRTLKAEKEKLQGDLRVQRDTIARVQSDLAFVKALKPVAGDALEDRLFLAEDVAAQLSGLAHQIGADTGALLAEQRTAEIRVRALEKEIARLDRELSQISGHRNPDTTRVAVGLDAARAGRITVRLQYVTPGAGWKPHYDARYRIDDGRVRLDFSGEVSQRTGEIWDDVELVLSTARPQEGTAPPTLTPFLLQEAYGGNGYLADEDKEGKSARGEGGASVGDRVTAFEFTARTPEDVAPDGTLRRVFLKSLDLDAKAVHQVVARRVEAAWLTAHAENKADFPLLSGSVSAYMGTAYVGEGKMPLTPPGETVDLSFGVDDRVRVKHVRLEQVEGGPKLLGNREHMQYGWKTTVTNRTGRTVDLRVFDQVPASREAAYEVETKTTPEVTIPTTGVFEWKTALKEGQSQDFILEYDVSWPEDERPVLME